MLDLIKKEATPDTRKNPRTRDHADIPILSKAGVALSKRERNLELARQLYATKGKAIIQRIIQIALDNEHPKQMEALKLCIDRVAPVSFFEKTGGVQRPTVQIIVGETTGVSIKTIEDTGETYDAAPSQEPPV